MQLWSDGCQKANLLLANPTGLPVDEPWYLVSNLDPRLDLVWSYSLRDEPERLDQLPLAVA